jgi:hypothetical protein
MVSTALLSMQQSQLLVVLVLLEGLQPHWLAIAGALVRLILGNLVLLQLQAHTLFVMFTRSTLEAFTI